MDFTETILRHAPPTDQAVNIQCLRNWTVQNDQNCDQLECTKYLIPFKVLDACEDGEKPFLLCRYNESLDGRQHRSPWTNDFHPKNTDSTQDDKRTDNETDLRRLEQTFNEVWNSYKGLYYGHESVGSVFLKETKVGSFEGLFGIVKKTSSGSWNSVSLVQAGDLIGESGEETCTYHVETHVHVVLQPTVESNGDACKTTADIGVTVSKSSTKECRVFLEKIPIHVSHIEAIGSLIEANEIDLRSNLEKVILPKNLEILETLQKKKQDKRPQINPLMGMVMNSDLLKKKTVYGGCSA